MQRTVALLGTISIFTGCLAAQTRPAATEPSSVTVTLVPPLPGDVYAGSERCSSCHKAESRQFSKTAHAAIAASAPSKDASPAASKDAKKSALAAAGVTGCEMCHGPGKAHVDAEEAAHGDDTKAAAAAKSIFAFHDNPKRNSERCMQCHQSSRDQKDFGRSTHIQHGVACNECHATHLVVENTAATALRIPQEDFFSVPRVAEDTRWLHNSLLKKQQPDLCFGCHGNERAEFALPVHHRVPEGLIRCTDCHNTHGSSNRAEVKQSGWETCTGCHTEKRGPFVYEHAAVRVEGCVACHTPHGSVTRMLLKRREERFLCLSCHVLPFADNTPHSRLGFQERGDCTRCHALIHGSNFDPDFLH